MSDKKRLPVLEILILVISVTAWLISNIGAPLRFTLDPIKVSYWHYISVAINLALAAVLLLAKRRKLVFIPLFFAVQPIAYILMYFIVINILGTNYTILTNKFTADILFFSFELLCFLPLIYFLSDRNPLRFSKEPSKPLFFAKFFQKHNLTKSWKGLVWFLFLLQTLVILGDAIRWHLIVKVPLEVYLKLLIYQVPFALILGFKEELVFRWIGMKWFEELFRSRWVAILLQALPWAIYHFFFGEGMPLGLPAFMLTMFGAFWFAFWTYELDSLWPAIVSHVLIESGQFYAMYNPIIHRYFGF